MSNNNCQVIPPHSNCLKITHAFLLVSNEVRQFTFENCIIQKRRITLPNTAMSAGTIIWRKSQCPRNYKGKLWDNQFNARKNQKLKNDEVGKLDYKLHSPKYTKSPKGVVYTKHQLKNNPTTNDEK